ncbi:TetR/AcrR family transcriptional regulator [Clostridium sp. 'deep sea']|uniref:TetR/AcrR family transcriptional regulator n=1 Tax=Clostridium sp. 'deep sea' TaxID=2779445 RepID=UPI0018969958|nr:TetR/AcrR family transcriptional regulator [Clostridium sp. 'deep sea']QOR33707.1 TetR/AcrR family transcriptional regulator [Clostridium sp. 'deep sea']
MPKIIKNIEGKILNAASELFIEQGYEKTDIRQIASKAQIAVGTLYNYYKNKDVLFYAVFEHKLTTTVASIKKAIEKTDDPEQRVYNFLRLMQKELHGNSKQGWKHLYKVFSQKKELLVSHKDVNEEIKKLFKNIETMIQNIYDDYSIKLTGSKIPESISIRMKPTIMMMLFSLTNKLPNEPEENIKYLHNIITCMCRIGRDYE